MSPRLKHAINDRQMNNKCALLNVRPINNGNMALNIMKIDDQFFLNILKHHCGKNNFEHYNSVI